MTVLDQTNQACSILAAYWQQQQQQLHQYNGAIYETNMPCQTCKVVMQAIWAQAAIKEGHNIFSGMLHANGIFLETHLKSSAKSQPLRHSSLGPSKPSAKSALPL